MANDKDWEAYIADCLTCKLAYAIDGERFKQHMQKTFDYQLFVLRRRIVEAIESIFGKPKRKLKANWITRDSKIAIKRATRLEHADAVIQNGGDRPIFHGGCVKCIVQDLSVCSGCQYLAAEWNLPDNSKHEHKRNRG